MVAFYMMLNSLKKNKKKLIGVAGFKVVLINYETFSIMTPSHRKSTGWSRPSPQVAICLPLHCDFKPGLFGPTDRLDFVYPPGNHTGIVYKYGKNQAQM